MRRYTEPPLSSTVMTFAWLVLGAVRQLTRVVVTAWGPLGGVVVAIGPGAR